MKRNAATHFEAKYIAQTIEAAEGGDVEAAEEALSLFRAAVDARAIDGSTAEHRRIAEYIAECFWQYSEGTGIDRALRLNASRRRGQPKGTRKVD